MKYLIRLALLLFCLPAFGQTNFAAYLASVQTFTAAQTFTNSDLKLLGSSTGATTFASANSSGTNYTLTFPAITDTVLTAASPAAIGTTTPAAVHATTLTSQPAAAATVDAGNVGYVISQTGLFFVVPASGYIDATGNVVIGLNPPSGATMFLSSSTAGSGITITFNAATLTGTAAGDTNRVITINDGAGVYKTFTITGNSGTSTTIAQGTLNSTLTTACTGGAPCAITKVWVSGTYATTNTAGTGAVMYPVPIYRGYASAYLYFPASSPIGTAGYYYCNITANASLATGGATTAVCFNNLPGGISYGTFYGTPQIPGSPTAFAGLTPAQYTQTTATYLHAALFHIPANAMGLNGELQLGFSAASNNTANNKTIGYTWNGSITFYSQLTTQPTYWLTTTVRNASAANLQSYLFTVASGSSPINTLGTSAVNTASQVSTELDINLATATDTAAVEGYSIKLWPN